MTVEAQNNRESSCPLLSSANTTRPRPTRDLVISRNHHQRCPIDISCLEQTGILMAPDSVTRLEAPERVLNANTPLNIPENKGIVRVQALIASIVKS